MGCLGESDPSEDKRRIGRASHISRIRTVEELAHGKL